ALPPRRRRSGRRAEGRPQRPDPCRRVLPPARLRPRRPAVLGQGDRAPLDGADRDAI
ncbi:MAG: hypothetical protein AVDCRST_MAG19-900, partial [uncultured Thermomicrobiales bacterium]